jgi:hypothetical protein
LKKLGFGFYQKYKEGIDYLIEAKYLEPYMRINFVEMKIHFTTAGAVMIKMLPILIIIRQLQR